MKPLDLQSEQFAATGNLASEGARNQLGRPRLDPLTVLVREAVQNSWDARKDPSGEVRSTFELRSLSAPVRQLLEDIVFEARPLEGLAFTERFGARAMNMLFVSDRNTSGLGGPTRADKSLGEKDSHDFVAFLRNLGEPPDKALGGGTYGYGKASFYAMSHLQTVLVHTRIPSGGDFETRFMGAALGNSFQNKQEQRFTGRHWWGREGRGGVIDPLLNGEADRLAAALGFPGFGPLETGTTIAVLDVRDEDGGLGKTAEHIRDALLWNFWPKMVPLAKGTVPMRFRLVLNGEAVHIPAPEDHPTLKHFVPALNLARRHLKEQPRPGFDALIRIGVLKPKIHTGVLALSRDFRSSEGRLPPDPQGRGPQEGGLCHVALMRSAELVVRYVEGPALPTDLLEYGGVFIADNLPTVDRAFAQAEPPTHDDWVDHQLPTGDQKTIVKVSLQRIHEAIREFATPASAQQRTSSTLPLGMLSTRLGGLLTGSPGPGAAVPTEERRASRSKPVVIETHDDEGDEGGFGDVTPSEVQGDGTGLGGSPPPGGDGQAPEPGDLAPPTSGGGDGLPPRAPPRPGRPRIGVRAPELAIEDGLPTLTLEVEVRHGAHTQGTDLIVDARALLDGGSPEREPPQGAAVPRVLRWVGPGGITFDRPGERLRVEAGHEGLWRLFVELVDDAEVQVSVKGERVLLTDGEAP